MCQLAMHFTGIEKMHLCTWFCPTHLPQPYPCPLGGDTSLLFIIVPACHQECAATPAHWNRRFVGKAIRHLLRLSHLYSQAVPHCLGVECSFKDESPG